MKKSFLYIASALFLLGSGCSKFEDFGNTNVDPGQVSQPLPAALLTSVMSNTKGNAFQTAPGYYAQYFSESQYPGVSIYSTQQVAFAGTYAASMYDLVNIMSLPSSTANQKAVAQILLQYQFWNLTDVFGDLPYSEAFKGAVNTKPKYDTQEQIYKSMLAALKAVTFDNSQIPGDIMNGGSIASWKKINNSLRMMIALQLSKKYPGANDYAATEFKAALADAGGIITTNADNWKITPPGGTYKSDYWAPYDGRKDLAVSKTFTDLLKGLNDTRMTVFGGASEQAGNVTSSDKGIPYGDTRANVLAFTNANPDWARVFRGDYRKETSTVYLLTAGQVTLARAEAANLGWTTEVLATLYTNGINLAYEQWSLTPPAGYAAQANVAVAAPGAPGNAEKIAIQRYIAHFPDGLQAWNITRKTGYPVLTPAPDAQNASKQIPNRYMYATAEAQTNKDNYDAAVARIPGGKDTQDAKVWWAQ